MSWAITALIALVPLQTPADSEVLGVLPAIVRSGWESGAKSDTQPLLLEIDSFRLHASMAADREIDSTKLAAAVHRPFRPVTHDEAIRCRRVHDTSPTYCSVLDDGVLVQLDCLTRTRAGFQALVTAEWTNRSDPDRTAIGLVHLRLWFAKEGETWVRKRMVVVMQT